MSISLFNRKQCRRRAAVSPALLWLVASLLTLLTLIGFIAIPTTSRDGEPSYARPLVVYCAASLRLPIEKIASRYQSEHTAQVQIHYGGSGTLLSQMEVSQTGDLYLAADDWYLKIAQEKGLVAEPIPLAQMKAVLAVARGNPRRIASLADLLQPKVRFAIAGPDQAAIGRVIRTKLLAVDRWDDIEQQVRQRGVFKPTVTDCASDIQLGSVDAGFLWDVVAAQYSQIEVVEIPELANATGQIGVGVVRFTKQREAAQKFARYLASASRGLRVLAENGYQSVATQPGDQMLRASNNQQASP